MLKKQKNFGKTSHFKQVKPDSPVFQQTVKHLTILFLVRFLFHFEILFSCCCKFEYKSPPVIF
jgi:hypothetical protein